MNSDPQKQDQNQRKKKRSRGRPTLRMTRDAFKAMRKLQYREIRPAFSDDL